LKENKIQFWTVVSQDDDEEEKFGNWNKLKVNIFFCFNWNLLSVQAWKEILTYPCS
jgi:hypothetical protein